MTVNVGKSERRQLVTYIVYAHRDIYFTFQAHQFSEARVIEECKKRGVKPNVRVTWNVKKKWGWDSNDQYVGWEESLW